MIAWDGNTWNQIKNKTCDELISALEKDGWEQDVKIGATLAYYNPTTKKRIVIHYHPHKTYRSPKLLKDLIAEIGWTESDLKKLKLIKR